MSRLLLIRNAHKLAGRIALASASMAIFASTAGAAGIAPLRGTDRIVGAADVVAVPDVSGDGRPDYVKVKVGVGGAVAVLFGTSDLDLDIAAIGELGTTAQPASGLLIRPSGSNPIQSVDRAGDFDGDGIGDLVVIADDAYVVYGAAGSDSLTLGSAGNRTTRLLTNDTGPAVDGRPLGDWNADGTGDLVMRRGLGAAIVHGGPRVASLDLRASNSRMNVISGIRTCTLFGLSCTTDLWPPTPAGDFNGDGKADVWLSERAFIAPGRTGSGSLSGATAPTGAVKFTGQEGAKLAPLGDVTGGPEGDVALLSASGANRSLIVAGRPISGTTTIDPRTAPVIAIEGAHVGIVPAGGDLTGDGRQDIIVYGLDGVRVVSVPATAPATISLASIPVIRGLRSIPEIDDRDAGYLIPGRRVSWSGDLDRDGAPDLLIPDAYADVDGARGVPALLIASRRADSIPPELLSTDAQESAEYAGRVSAITPARFVAGAAPLGTTIRLTPTEPNAAVEMTVRRGTTVVGKWGRSGLPAGPTQVAWDGLSRGVNGVPGDYSLDLVPIDLAGNRGAKQSLAFSIVGGEQSSVSSLKVSQRTEIASGVVPPRAALSRRLTGTCPNAIDTTTADGAATPVSIERGLVGDVCTLKHVLGARAYWTPGPSNTAWTSRVSINGAPAVQVGVTGEDFSVSIPSFALRAGENTVEIVDHWTGTGEAPAWNLAGSGFWYGPAASAGGNSARLLPDGGGLQLTTAASNLRGSIVARDRIFDARNVDISFDATLDQGRGGGNGLALAVHEATRVGDDFYERDILGAYNAGLGWAGNKGFAFGLGTFQGTGNANPSDNFVGVAQGTGATSAYPEWLQTADPGKPLAFATSRVRVVSKDGVVTMSIDGIERIRRTMELPAFAFIGFTAATGGAARAQRHLVRNVVVTTP